MTTLARRLTWGRCQNARDLGGLPTFDGEVIRPLALVRSDNLDRLGEDGVRTVRALRPGLVLDLRSSWEAARFPNPLADDACYRHVSLLETADETLRTRLNALETLEAYYDAMVDEFALLIGRALAAMADAPPGPIVVHCHAGKDRTGLIVALALSVAGVRRSAIAEDYAFSDACLAEHYAAELAELHDEERRARLRSWQHSRPATILNVLDRLEREYGSVAAYLRRAGVTTEQSSALKARLRIDASAPG